MTEINLDQFTEFSKIKNIWNDCFHDRNSLFEFLHNVVINKNDDDCVNGHGNMLAEFSDIYVLVSKKDFPFEKLTSIHKISIDLSKSKKNFILGYITVYKTNDNSQLHFINFINTRISKLNIAKYMIKKYEEIEKNIFLFPYEIIFGSHFYWKKYFIEKYNIKNKKDLLHCISNHGLDNYNIQWSFLLDAFDN